MIRVVPPAFPLTYRERVAATALLAVATLILANVLFNAAARLAGWPFPFANFLTRPDDNFADFFAPITCFPHGEAARIVDRAGIHALLPWPALWATPPGATGEPIVTIFHLPPVDALVYLLLARAVDHVDAVVLFLATMGAMAGWWVAIAHRFAATAREGWLWAMLGLISYPAMLVLIRGNLLSGLTLLLLAEALLLALDRRRPIAMAVLLAVAVNLRPNALLLAIVPWALLVRGDRWRFVLTLGLAGAAIGLAALGTTERLFPAYSLAAFREGVALYYRYYAIGFWGLPYGSSLFGAMKLLTAGYHDWLNRTALAIALAPLLAGYLLHRRGALTDSALLHLAISAYCMGSTVLGDYHLGAFLLVPMAIAKTAPCDEATRRAAQIAGLAACLMLAPKNYIFWGTTSAQVLLNPLILLASTIAIVACALPRRARIGALRSRAA